MSHFGLWITERAAVAVLNITKRDVTRHAANWTRSTRADGGFWTGDFTITSETMTGDQMAAAYDDWIGKRIVEVGALVPDVNWEGMIVEMTLTLGGVQYTTSLDLELWHNNVVVNYGHDNTASSENTESSDVYGESQYIDYVGTAYTSTEAEARRDRRLADNAFPKSRPSGGLTSGETPNDAPNSLHVVCAGYVLSMNWLYQTTDVAAANVSTQIEMLVGNSEFVTAGIIEENTLQVPITAAGINPRLWDLIQELIGMGDASGNRYIGGVYGGRVFNYTAAETSLTHYWRNGRLYDELGCPVLPTVARPDMWVQVLTAPSSHPNVSGVVSTFPQNVYIEEVEFSAPNSLRMIPAGSY